MSEWEAYDRLDPIGKWRDDFKLAYLSSLITNIAIRVHGKKGAPLTKVKDFLLNWDVTGTKVEVQSVEEQKKLLMSIFGAHNKRVAKKSKSPVVKTEKK